jgi:TPR repeat protein
MPHRESLAISLRIQAAAVLALCCLPFAMANAGTPSVETIPSKAAGLRPSLADGIAAMKRGSEYLAFEIIQDYAEQGYRVAEMNLANLYLYGLGTEKDPVTARALLERAAAQGLPLAYGQLGAIYQQGLGTEADPAQALNWYRRGAALGDPASLYGLGLMYQNGNGVAASLREAAKWYRMSAARGHARAQFMLGVMLFQGRGVPKDLVESYKWFALAHQSLPPGLDRERSAKATSLIEASLPHDQLQAARASAASWKPTE